MSLKICTFDSVRNVEKGWLLFSSGCCQTACVPVWGEFELKTSNLFETTQHCHFCDWPLSNRNRRNEHEAIQLSNGLFYCHFPSFRYALVLVSCSAHSGLAKVLSFKNSIYFCFIPYSKATFPVGQKCLSGFLVEDVCEWNSWHKVLMFNKCHFPLFRAKCVTCDVSKFSEVQVLHPLAEHVQWILLSWANTTVT